MDTHDYVPDCECRDCLRVTLRDTVAAAERLALERAEFRRDAERLRAELAALRAQEPVAWMTRTDTERVFWMNSPKSIFHDATPLYASPAPAAVPEVFPGTADSLASLSIKKKEQQA